MLVSGSVAQGVCDKGRCVCGGGSGGMEVESLVYSQGEVRVGTGGGIHILTRGQGKVCLESCRS